MLISVVDSEFELHANLLFAYFVGFRAAVQLQDVPIQFLVKSLIRLKKEGHIFLT